MRDMPHANLDGGLKCVGQCAARAFAGRAQTRAPRAGLHAAASQHACCTVRAVPTGWNAERMLAPLHAPFLGDVPARY